MCWGLLNTGNTITEIPEIFIWLSSTGLVGKVHKHSVCCPAEESCWGSARLNAESTVTTLDNFSQNSGLSRGESGSLAAIVIQDQPITKNKTAGIEITRGRIFLRISRASNG